MLNLMFGRVLMTMLMLNGMKEDKIIADRGTFEDIWRGKDFKYSNCSIYDEDDNKEQYVFYIELDTEKKYYEGKIKTGNVNGTFIQSWGKINY